ncbi:hypothetical protein [Rhodovulum sulfidophilum]|nr:hypothetical protein [Rhodovulum sulfidophilum]
MGFVVMGMSVPGVVSIVMQNRLINVAGEALTQLPLSRAELF